MSQGPAFPGAPAIAQVFYTAEQVSEMTGRAVSAYWLVRKAREDEISAHKVGRAWRWTDDDIAALAEYCKRSPHEPSAPRRGS